MSKKAMALFVAVLVLALLFGCSKPEPEPEPKRKTYYEFFDTVSVIYSYAEDGDAEFEHNVSEVFAILDKYHKLFNIYYEYSGINNLCTINRKAYKEPVEVERELIDFLLYAKELYTLTNGEMNIAFGAVTRLWHDERELAEDGIGKLPDHDKLVRASEFTDINSIIIDEQASTVFFANDAVRIDVGAVGKGYATEKAAQHLESKGVSGYVLDIGRNIRCVGARPSGKGWKIGVANPDKSASSYLETLVIDSVSCVTSGNYERYYTVDGKRYHHIIDKDTLMPSEYFTLVNVICKDSGLADALSTALFCMPIEDGKKVAEALGAEVLWLTSGGEIYKTDGYSAYVSK